MLPQYSTNLFSEIYSSADDMLEDYTNYEAEINDINKVDDNYVTLTWALIMSKFGQTPIRSMSESQFKLQLFGIMFNAAPSFQKRVETQSNIRELTIAQLQLSTTQVSNAADNPDTNPTTNTIDELTYINRQVVNKRKRSLPEAYALLIQLLDEDISETYVSKFDTLFKKVLVPAEYIYVTEGEEDE